MLFCFNIILKIIPYDKVPYNIKKTILIVNTKIYNIITN